MYETLCDWINLRHCAKTLSNNASVSLLSSPLTSLTAEKKDKKRLSLTSSPLKSLTYLEQTNPSHQCRRRRSADKNELRRREPPPTQPRPNTLYPL